MLKNLNIFHILLHKKLIFHFYFPQFFSLKSMDFQLSNAAWDVFMQPLVISVRWGTRKRYGNPEAVWPHNRKSQFFSDQFLNSAIFATPAFQITKNTTKRDAHICIFVPKYFSCLMLLFYSRRRPFR